MSRKTAVPSSLLPFRPVSVLSSVSEVDQLRSAWMRHSPRFLDSYLVQSVENPCLNPQSLLVRRFLADSLFPNQHRDIFEQEMLFSAAACTLLTRLRMTASNTRTRPWTTGTSLRSTSALPRFLAALQQDGHGLPFAVRGLRRQLEQAESTGYEDFVSPFELLWRERFQTRSLTPRPMLEIGCGSANDYRYFSRCGLDRFVNYTGVDLCAHNVSNARRRCPQGTFLEADALHLPFPDKVFDFCCIFDSLEHLSLPALQRALEEAVRVTRRRLWLSFFQMEWQPEHCVVPAPPYHRNILSAARVQQALAELGWASRVIDIPALYAREFSGYQHYNPRARVIAASVGAVAAGLGRCAENGWSSSWKTRPMIRTMVDG